MSKVIKSLSVALNDNFVVINDKTGDALKDTSDNRSLSNTPQDEYEALKKELEEAKIECDDLLKQKDIIISDAKKTAETLIAEAKEQVDVYKTNAEEMLTSALEEARTNGYNVGMENGLKEGRIQAKEEVREDAKTLLDDLASIITQIEESKQNIIENFEDEIKNLCVAIAERIVRTQLNIDATLIQEIVKDALRGYRSQDWVKIAVSSQDAFAECLASQEFQDYLSKVSEHIYIVEKNDISSGSLQIETPSSVIDASVSTQIENVRDMFK